MAGIYIHIPFCRQACYYCDFHFSTYLALKEELINAMAVEISWQKNFLNEPVETIYFGGGTPSLLNSFELEKIFSAIHKNFIVISGAEITLEANPENLNSEKAKALQQFQINRLSMGIQSFNDSLLKYLNRAHTGRQAIESYYQARSAGINNINCDLIFAIPGQNMEILEKDLVSMAGLKPEHVSPYCLTIEEKTVFGNWQKKNKLRQIDEDRAAEQMLMVWDFLGQEGYEQYEISNFCRNGFYSKHNSAYWKDIKYLGIGPGAHSYDGQNRFFNISNNSLYIKAIRQGRIPSTRENIFPKNRANDYILTSLRTIWGVDLKHLENKYGIAMTPVMKNTIESLIESGLATVNKDHLILTRKGKLLADHISMKLFIE